MRMNELGVLLLGIVIGIYLIVILLAVTDNTYRNGQIDALNGKIIYHIVAQDNGTTAWEKIK